LTRHNRGKEGRHKRGGRFDYIFKLRGSGKKRKDSRQAHPGGSAGPGQKKEGPRSNGKFTNSDWSGKRSCGVRGLVSCHEWIVKKWKVWD